MNKSKKHRSFIILSALAVIIAASGILVGCESVKTNDVQDTLADSLYEYKNTYVGNNSKVVAIVDLMPKGELIRDKVELQTYDTPYGVGVFYKAADRDKWRENLGQYETIGKRNAAVMFALITNMDSLSIDISDQYGHFAGSYILLDNLNEFFATDYFTKENLQVAVADKENFKVYVDKVMSMNPPSEIALSNREKMIYSTLGKGRQITLNSGWAYSFVLERNLAAGGFDLDQAAKESNIDITKYYGKTIDVLMYETENYSGQENLPYVFVFHDDELIGYKNLENDKNFKALARECEGLNTLF